MTRRFALSLFTALLVGATAQAAPVTFSVILNTAGIVTPGFIEFQFNQANSGTSLSAIASLSDFDQSGFTLDLGSSGGSTGVTGSIDVPPVVIPNDVGAANYYDVAVTNWGSIFKFVVTLSGPALDTPAPDGSGFFVFLLDSGFAPIVGPLPSGEVANVIINPDTTFTWQGSTFDGGSAIVLSPEPASVVLGLSGLALVALRRRRKA